MIFCFAAGISVANKPLLDKFLDPSLRASIERSTEFVLYTISLQTTVVELFLPGRDKRDLFEQ